MPEANDFASNISVAFRELRDHKDNFDVTLACNEDQINAHKVIFSTCSTFFRAVLRRNRRTWHKRELSSLFAAAEELMVKGLTKNQSMMIGGL